MENRHHYDQCLMSAFESLQASKARLRSLEIGLQREFGLRNQALNRVEASNLKHLNSILIKVETLKCERVCLDAVLREVKVDANHFQEFYMKEMRSSRTRAQARCEHNRRVGQEIARLMADIRQMEATDDDGFRATLTREEALAMIEAYANQTAVIDAKIQTYDVYRAEMLSKLEAVANERGEAYSHRISEVSKAYSEILRQVVRMRNELREYYSPAEAVALATWAGTMGKYARSKARMDLTHPTCALDTVTVEALRLRWIELYNKKNSLNFLNTACGPSSLDA